MDDPEELAIRLKTVLAELSDLMQQRKDRIEELRTKISVIQNENEDMEKRINELIMDAF